MPRNLRELSTPEIRKEIGGGAQLSSLIRLLRAYGELHRLDALLANPISPLRIADMAFEERDG